MSKPLSLGPSEAACLDALRSGIDRKMLIAVRTRLTLKQTAIALKSLDSLGIAATNGGRIWYLTRRVIGGTVSRDALLRKRGRKPITVSAPSPAAQRLLALLDRPRRAPELAALLNVTSQRVHQLLVVLSALVLIRSPQPEHPTAVVASKEDPSLLLRQDQERALSAFPETGATTLSKIAAATGMRTAVVATTVEFLSNAGLIEMTGTATFGDLYQLTAAGAAHWQRSATTRRADIPPPPFRSDRVHDVLTYLEGHGPIRTRDIGARLGIPPTSINALMQYLKRKNAVSNQTDIPYSPYGLTPEGRQMLMVMRRARRSEQSDSLGLRCLDA